MELYNPYRINLPAQISFSGGRTSGFMLRQILDAHGGELPKDCRVTFFNTGKEREETLVFVQEVATRWKVPIVWLEYDNEPNPDGSGDLIHTYRVVNFETASRKGEPFEKLILAKRYLPNVVTRFCTVELKVRTGRRWMTDQGYEHWTCAVGIRADEPKRLGGRADMRERWERVHPLADAGVVVDDVMSFWSKQSFDLQLRQDQGNCDLCFLKGRRKLMKLVQEEPGRADWWIEMEKRIGQGRVDAVSRFSNRRSYEELRVWAMGGPLFADLPDDEVEDCSCTD